MIPFVRTAHELAARPNSWTQARSAPTPVLRAASTRPTGLGHDPALEPRVGAERAVVDEAEARCQLVRRPHERDHECRFS